MDGMITMSHKELSRLEVIQRIEARRMSQVAATQLLNLSVRQVKRLCASYRSHGPAGLASKKRGKTSNRRFSEDFREQLTELIQDKYSDFGSTLATEKLCECHGTTVSLSFVRGIMIDAGLWQTRSQKLKRVYQPRNRRDCLGELIQIDGSDHDWFEGRAPKCTLLVYIDDATSELMQLLFVPEESTYAYFKATKAYLLQHGRPVAFYSDKHSVFRVNQAGDKGKGDRITQFGRALTELNIDIICANTSQAKGRVERANKTLQDRLVKELRLQKISSIDEANAFLPAFTKVYNHKFRKPPLKDTNLHRPLTNGNRAQLDEIFCWQEERTLSNNLTLQYDKIMYLVEDTPKTRLLKRKRVVVYDHPDHPIQIKHEGKVLPYKVHFDRIRKVEAGDIVENKRLSNVLRFIQDEQQKREPIKRSQSCPSRSINPEYRRRKVTIHED